MKRTVRYIVLFFTFFLLIFKFNIITAQETTDLKNIKIVVLTSHNYDEYQQAFEGFKKALTETNIKFTISMMKDLGNTNVNGELVAEIQKSKPDLILTLGSTATYTISSYIQDIPIVFSMVLYPNMNNSNNSKGNNSGNITGVSLSIPVDKQFSVLKQIIPNLKTIGVIYSADENLPLIKEAQQVAKVLNLNLIAADVTDERDVPQALNNLIRIVDALWMIVDKSINSTFSRTNLILEGFRNNIPVMGLSENYVRAGAAIAVSADYMTVGMQTGKLAIQILNGESPAEIPIEYPQKLNIYINEKIIDGIGLKIPTTILKKVIKISK